MKDEREASDLIRISVSRGDGPHESQWTALPPVYLGEDQVEAYLEKNLYSPDGIVDWQYVVLVRRGVPFAACDRIHLGEGERVQWRSELASLDQALNRRRGLTGS